ncbi:MAG TPA: hypothetical protein VL286_04035 [Rhizomicrobium sp.]|nr:hypothetical protein [Rhizomicrobium sp.]
MLAWIADVGGRPISRPLREAVAILAICPILLGAALWNGFPLIFYDTGAYIFQSFGDRFVPERSPVYSLFIRWAGGGESLWLVASVQVVMIAFVLAETARALAPRVNVGTFFAISSALAILTGLPWYAAQIEPDCFAGIVVLALYLLAFHAGTLGWWRSGLLVLVAGIATGSHPSHLGLAAGLVLVLVLYKGLTLWSPDKRWPRANLVLPAIAAILGFGLVAGGNYAFTKHVFVSRAGPVFVFARMLQDGLVKQVLDETCPSSHLVLCHYRNVLPSRADDWLWGPGTPFVAMHRFIGTERESERVVNESLARHPVANLAIAARDAVQQFETFSTGDQIEPQQWILYTDFRRFIPYQLHAYSEARQQKGGLDFAVVNAVHVPVAWLALAFLIAMLALALKRGESRPAVVLGFVLAALIGNAIICGVLSNPHARYQSRMIWVPVFALALLASERLPLRTQ